MRESQRKVEAKQKITDLPEKLSSMEVVMSYVFEFNVLFRVKLFWNEREREKGGRGGRRKWVKRRGGRLRLRDKETDTSRF